ncbi:MAG: (d)CMP kinase [Chloroflexi bacterium]|nr:(d)CMP kinase [Chloroflexota bacterium]
MNLATTIAIDGPAASGKSTIGRMLADHLGYLFFDTGVMYRAVALAALQQGVDVGDEDAVVRLASELAIEVLPPDVGDGRPYTVVVNGEDVTWQLRMPEVDRLVSPVSAYAGVRQVMTQQQRRIGQRGRVVMVGRDIGTVVMPEAPLKIYLDASVMVRAQRRYQERLARGEAVDFDDVLRVLASRDRIDSERATAPLRQADDAVCVNTDQMDALAVFELVRRLAQPDLQPEDQEP